MEAKPQIVSVSPDNQRFKKRKSFRHGDVVAKAMLVSGLLLMAVVAVMFALY